MINTKIIRVKGYAGQPPQIHKNKKTGEDFGTFSLGVPVGSKDNPDVEWIDINCGSHLIETISGITTGTKLIIVGTPVIGKRLNNSGELLDARFRIYVDEIDYLSSSGQSESKTIASQIPPTPLTE